MSFNKNKHIEKMQSSVNKLVAQLKTKGIEFSPDDVNGHENVTFTTSEKTVNMSKHSFYRYSGVAVFTKDKGGNSNESETVEVTDEMYMQMIIKPIVETLCK